MHRFATCAAKGWLASSALHAGALAAAVSWQAGLFESAVISPRGGRMSIDSIASLAGNQPTLELTEQPVEATFLAPPTNAALDQIEPTAESLVDPLSDSTVDATPPQLEALSAPLDERDGSTFVLPNPLADVQPPEEADERPDETAQLPRPQSPPSDNLAPTQPPTNPPVATAAASHGNATVNSINSLADQGNDVERLPQFARNLPIAYPQEAFNARWEGVARLRLTISADGRVTDVEVVGSSGFVVLDEAARKGVATWRAEPAKLAGAPVASTHVMRVIFKL